MFWAYQGEEKIRASPREEARCGVCGEKLIPKCGDIKVWHWAHKKDSECDHWVEPETEWHKEWKNNFDKKNQEVIIKKGNPEYPVKHIADIKTNEGLVIEIQNSTISKEDIEKREDFYENMIWVLNGNSIAKNIYVKQKEDKNYFTFQWKYPPKSWWNSKKQLYVDFSERVKFLNKKLKQYEEGEKQHFSAYYETYEFYNQEVGEYMEGSRIAGQYEDTEDHIYRLKETVELLEGKMLEIKKIHKKSPCHGWGVFVNKNLFIKIKS